MFNVISEKPNSYFMETQIQSKNVISKEVLDFQLNEEFSIGIEKFANNPLHLKLKSDVVLHEKLKFVPRMLFFVLGFKDIMKMVRYENETNDLEKSVNTHSDEDSYHWKWYLTDLAYMSEDFKKTNSISLITDVWDDRTWEVRKTIYAISSYVKSYDHPVARMLIIEVLELTFDKFKEALHPVLKDADIYDRLDYFGKKHQDTEENHTTGISEDEISDLIGQLPEEMKKGMILVVRELFDQMYNMTANWAEA